MRRGVLIVAGLALLFGSQIQAQEPIHWDAVAKIRTEGLDNSQVMETLFMLTEVHGPRLTGSPGLKSAMEWSKGQLMEWGMSKAAIEPWGTFGKGWSLKKISVEMLAPRYMPIVAMPQAWTAGTKGLIKGQPVLIDAEDEEELEKYAGKLKDKIVLLSGPREYKLSEKPDVHRHTEESLAKLAQTDLSKEGGGDQYAEMRARFRKYYALQRKKLQFLRDEGVAIILEVSERNNGVVRNGAWSRSARKLSEPAGMPHIKLALEHYNRIARLTEREIPVELAIQVETAFHEQDSLGYNVVAEIPGTDKKLKSELVMLGAHLDSWHPGTGVTDNGAGSAVMMEVMRILKAIDARPRRTIRLALWTGEEQGLLGSREYVKKHFGDPKTREFTKKHSKFSGYFNMDNGSGRVRGVYLQGNQAVLPIFDAWLKPFHDLDAKTVTMDNTGGTDHLAFDAVGLPGFQFIQDGLEYRSRTHHTHLDTYDHASAADLKQASTIIASFVYHTAMRDQKLPRKPLPAPTNGSSATAAR